MVSAFLENLLPGSTSIALGHLAPLVPAFVVLGYLAVLLDRRRDGSPSQGDRQVGLKLVVFGLGLAGLAFAATGAYILLAYVLSGFKGGTEPIKSSLANLISGGAVVAGVILVLLPATNTKEQPQVERYAIGAVALVAGFGTVMAYNQFVHGLFTGAGWGHTSARLAELLVSSGAAFLSITRLGAMSGWTSPMRSSAAGAYGQPGYPPGYPQQPGYPPGYPPAGYAPPQAGYPPQGGSYPQPGSNPGYPPTGSGGSGGYPPR
jgi:hypothetical protein